MMSPKSPIDAIEKAAENLRAARELADRQRTLIVKFESEGLDTFAERNLLHGLQNVLRLDEARIGRLLYEDALTPRHKKRRSRP